MAKVIHELIMSDSWLNGLSTTLSLSNIIFKLNLITLSNIGLLQNRFLGTCIFRPLQAHALKMLDVPKPELGDLCLVFNRSLNSESLCHAGYQCPKL